MNDPTDPDLVFDLDTVRLVAASAPEPVGAMLTSMADALDSLRERYRMAEVIADIARMKVRADDTPVPLKDGDKMPMILSWVCRTLAACLEAKGAPNYFGWGWTDEETGKSYRVRVQHDTGKSPECVAAEARDERDAARRDLAEARATRRRPCTAGGTSAIRSSVSAMERGDSPASPRCEVKPVQPGTPPKIPVEPCPACAVRCASILDKWLIGLPNVYECAEHGMFEAFTGGPGVLTRHRKVCLRCGHKECPCCESWCDELVGADLEACCGGKCVYPPPCRIMARPFRGEP